MALQTINNGESGSSVRAKLNGMFSDLYGANTVLDPYIGYVDNRGMWPDAVASSGSPIQVMVRSLRYARCNIMYPRPRIPIGFYVTSTNVETTLAGTYGVRASIEYPVGVFTQCLFGGNVTGTYSGGSIAMPDPVLVGIPRGATYFVKYWIDSPNGYVYTNNYAGIAGDAANVATTTADLTMSAMAGSTPGAVGHGPIGVVDLTTQRSFFLIGDSLMSGAGTDTRDISGDFGVTARLIGARRGYSNSGRSSTSIEQYLTGANATLRNAEGNTYASDIVCNHGVNSALNSIASATFLANLRALRGIFPTKRFYQHTVTPLTNGGGSAWALLDASDQVINPTASPLVDAYNVGILAGAIASNTINLSGVINTSAAVQYQLNAQKIAPGLTSDGIHLNVARANAIVAGRTDANALLW